MGAFFLFHKNTMMSLSGAKRTFQSKGFAEPNSFQIGNYHLLLYKKQLLDVENYYSVGHEYVFACGSIIYKGLNFRNSLEMLLRDFTNCHLDEEELLGNYVLIFYSHRSSKINILIDPSFVKSLYINRNNRIISSDFLAIVAASSRPITLNAYAIVENLVTGNLVSPDTYVNEIQKIDKINYKEIYSDFPGIVTKEFHPKKTVCVSGFLNAVDHANGQLSHYFSSLKRLSDDHGAHIGLTGGFDSRLLLMHARKSLNRLITNSFWSPNSIDYDNAKKLALAACLRFVSFEERRFKNIEYENIMSKSYFQFDGQFRSSNNWDEEFSLPEYAAQIAENHFVGFHGCGGEQYRNRDRLIGKIPWETFLRYEWMFKQGENPFLDESMRKDVSSNIEQKIFRLIGVTLKKVGLIELKKIQNEVWISANRATRLNALNRQMFYFAPFTEYRLAQSAYEYVPYLGSWISFQREMMRRVDPVLSREVINYGFSIEKGEPLRFKLIPYLMKTLPKPVLKKFLFALKKTHPANRKLDWNRNEMHPYLRQIENKLDLIKLEQNVNLRSGLSACNFFLQHLK